MYISLLKHVLLFLILLFITTPGLANEPEMNWGRIDASILETDDLTDDPDASAVILFDKADVYFNADGNLIIERHRRIKILDPDASSYTDVSINHNQRSFRYRLSGLRAQTINLDNNGNVQTERLRSRDFFEERHEDNWRTTSFTFSDVRPGSVVEYDYQIQTTSTMFLIPWYFQHDEPILYSKLTTYVPEVLSYLNYRTGMVNEIEISSSDHYLPNQRIFPDFLTRWGGRIQEYTAANLPAIRDEPYMTTVNDHRTKINFQLYQRGVGGSVETVLDDWEEMAAQLSLHSDFGRQLGRANRDIRNRVESLTEGLETELEKAQAIYDYVTTSISWNGNRGLFSSDGIRRTYSESRGSGPDITFLYIAMLREAGIEAYPVILSTRSNGRIYPDWPIVSQYNHVVAFLVADFMEYLTEPLSPYLPFGNLLPQSLSYLGKIIDRNYHGWVELNPMATETNQSLAMMTMDEQGGIDGRFQVRMAGYGALNNRIRLANQVDTETEFVLNHLLSDFPDAEIIEHEIRNVDERNSPLESSVQVRKEDYAMVAGDMMYINPFLLNTWTENPFTLQNRSFPAQFNYGIDHQYTLNLTLPEGYVVEELPESSVIALTEYTAYQQVIQPMGNVVQVVTNLKVDDLEIAPEFYEHLQEFFRQIVSMQSSQIVLKKVEDETEADQADTSDDAE